MEHGVFPALVLYHQWSSASTFQDYLLLAVDLAGYWGEGIVSSSRKVRQRRQKVRKTIAIWTIKIVLYLFYPIVYPWWRLAWIHQKLIAEKETKCNELES